MIFSVVLSHIQMLGFTAKFAQPEDGAWGTDQGNLTWNGMVGMLQR